MQTASSTYIERLMNIPIRKEVDHDDRRNDHTEQNRPGVVSAKQLNCTANKIKDLEDDDQPDCEKAEVIVAGSAFALDRVALR